MTEAVAIIAAVVAAACNIAFVCFMQIRTAREAMRRNITMMSDAGYDRRLLRIASKKIVFRSWRGIR